MTSKQTENDEVKNKYLSLVKDIREQGHDLVEQPILFRWVWPECPDVEFQLLIKGLDAQGEEQLEFDFSESETVH